MLKLKWTQKVGRLQRHSLIAQWTQWANLIQATQGEERALSVSVRCPSMYTCCFYSSALTCRLLYYILDCFCCFLDDYSSRFIFHHERILALIKEAEASNIFAHTPYLYVLHVRIFSLNYFLVVTLTAF